MDKQQIQVIVEENGINLLKQVILMQRVQDDATVIKATEWVQNLTILQAKLVIAN